MKFKSFIKKAVALSTLLPAFAFAQGTFTSTYFTSLLAQLKTIMQAVVPLLITAAIIVFFYELIQFILNKDKGDAAKLKTVRDGMIWSLVAIFVMLSFLGIIRIAQTLTGTRNPGNINATDIPIVTF